MTVSKRVVLVVAVGLLAGVVFAGITTRSIHCAGLIKPERAPSAPFAGHQAGTAEDQSSWVDRGIAVLTEPAAPFGQDAWDAGRDQEGLAETTLNPMYGSQDEAYRSEDDAPDGYDVEEERYADEAASESHQANRSPQTTPPAKDAAAEAAARARAAAQDVLAAESGT